MPFYTLAQAAAAWSQDRNGSFLMDWDNRPQPEPEVAPQWRQFVPAMQALADCGEDNEVGGSLLYVVQVNHPVHGPAVVAWLSHVEGRGPCTVELTVLFSTQREQCSGPALGGTPGPLLAEYMANGTWQYAGNPSEVGLPAPQYD